MGIWSVTLNPFLCKTRVMSYRIQSFCLTNFPDRFSQLLSLLAGPSLSFMLTTRTPNTTLFFPVWLLTSGYFWSYLFTADLGDWAGQYFFFFGHSSWLVESQFPDQGVNPAHGQWKPGILITRPPGNFGAGPCLDRRLWWLSVLEAPSPNPPSVFVSGYPAQSLSHVWLFMTHQTVALQAVLGDSPGKNTGVGCHFLLQGLSWPRGLLCLLHWQGYSLPLSHRGSPPTTSYQDQSVWPTEHHRNYGMSLLRLDCGSFFWPPFLSL